MAYVWIEMQSAIEKYWKLFLLWTAATLLLLVANLAVPASYALGASLFVVGAIALGAAGISCAYVIARDNA